MSSGGSKFEPDTAIPVVASRGTNACAARSEDGRLSKRGVKQRSQNVGLK